MWSHCYTLISCTTLFQGHMKSLLYSFIWYNIVSRPHEVIVILLYLVQHCFKAMLSHCYTLISGTTLFQGHMKSLLYSYIWYNIVSRPHEVIVIFLYLVQHCFKAIWSHCYTLISGIKLFKATWSHCYTHIWYNIVSRPCEVIVILISGTTLFQGHVKSLLYSYIWYNTVSRSCEVIVILLYLVQHCFKAMWSHCYTLISGITLFKATWSHCYTHIWYNIVSRPCEVIVILISGTTLFQGHVKPLLYSYLV